MHTWPASSLSTNRVSSNCLPIRRPGTRKYSSTGLLTTWCRSLSSRRATVFQKLFILCQTKYLVRPLTATFRMQNVTFFVCFPVLFFFFFMLMDSTTAYLSVGDYNVIGVDWSELARAPFYNSAATNTRDVGKAAADLVDFLVNEGTPISYIHLLGFSLGAHAAGWAGASVKVGTLPRITGICVFFAGNHFFFPVFLRSNR